MSEMTFKERYKKLNPEQKKAVDTIDGPLMVIAGPGTGKTTILTLRIAQILRETDTPAHGILAITYTDAGVKAIREKLVEIMGNRAHDVCIHTFHSFASSMIAEYPDHFIEIRDFRQITPVEQESLIRVIITSPEFTSLRPLGRPDVYISSIIRAISDSKKEALSPGMVRDNARKEIKYLKNDERSLSTRGATKGELKAEVLEKLEKLEKTVLLSKVYQIYEEEKRKAKLRDYDDLIMELLLALRNDKLFLRLIQERFLYVLVDEHQDTNDSQNYILNLIAEFFETPNVFIVGDEKQAIYRFQGASVENFLLLRKRWPKMKVISLNKNYRSHQGILDASFALIEHNYNKDEYKDLRVELKSGNNSKKRPLDVVISENTIAMERYLTEEIKRIIKEDSQSTVAIITRRNRELERILQVLESQNILVSSERTVDIFHHPVGAVFWSLLEYLADSSRIDSLSHTLIAGLWGVSFKESTKIIRNLKNDQVDFDRDLPALKKIHNRLLHDGAVGGIIDIAEYCQFNSLIARDPIFIHLWRGIITLAESISRDTDTDNPLELIKLMLLYTKSAELRPVKVSVGAPDFPVKAMTAHGSKGLEFDYVFIPYASEDTWIGRNHGSSFILPKSNSNEQDIRDIRRLFYVALTRAKKHNIILWSKEESDGKKLFGLRFIPELHPDNITILSLPREDISIGELHKLGNTKSSDFFVNEAKNILVKDGLSVTALNHFLECPNKFLYESVLRMPQAPVLSAEKGTAMHEAIASVWATSNRSVKNIEKTIINITFAYVDKSLIAKGDKEILKKELKLNAPIVAKSLFSHFGFSGKIYSECWVEKLFDFLYDKKQITISLHGKLDAILDSGHMLDIFDYKTRGVISLSAIKGETKSSDGSYFRQLIFYHLLSSGDYRFKNKKISTSLIFLTPNTKGKCHITTVSVGYDDIKKVEKEIMSLIDSVWSGKIGNDYCSLRSCKYCGYRRLLL